MDLPAKVKGLKLLRDAGLTEQDRKLVLTEVNFDQEEDVYRQARVGIYKYLADGRSQSTVSIKLREPTKEEEEVLETKGWTRPGARDSGARGGYKRGGRRRGSARRRTTRTRPRRRGCSCARPRRRRCSRARPRRRRCSAITSGTPCRGTRRRPTRPGSPRASPPTWRTRSTPAGRRRCARPGRRRGS